ncbi:AAA family ATPase [Lachnospiraceae bacterium ZAX-1]
MKPLKLTMSAFGSYVDTQTIDFTKLGANGLYLITGETGSGKTTIFDAISYALFGRASGISRNKYQMLRSDYVKGRVKTFVALDFSIGDRVHHIIRTIMPHIARNTEEVTYTDSVCLTLSDKTTISRDSEVKSKIAQIVGLDREQFAQIVMIAQNDFLRFLQSDTGKRVEILRHIFGTAALKDFQENLKSQVRERSGELDMCRHDFARYEVDPYRRDEKFSEWEIQMKTDKATLLEAERELALDEEKKTGLVAQTAVAAELSKKFSDLDEVLALLEKHVAKADEMKRLAGRRTRGEVALHRVKPLADKATEAGKQYEGAQSDLAKAKTDAKTTFTEYEEAKKVLDDLPLLDGKRVAFDTLKQEWEQSKKRLKELNSLQENYKEIEKKQTKLDLLQAELSKVLKMIEGLPPLADAQTAFGTLKQELDKAQMILKKLTLVQADYEAITTNRSKLGVLQSEFEIQNTTFHAADDKYKQIEEAFLRGQAGMLAAVLAEGEPCPVCGSTNHPAPACPIEGDITQSKLKKAKDVVDKARTKRDEKTTECSTLVAHIDTLFDRFLVDLSEFAPDATLETAEALLLEAFATASAKVKTCVAKKAVDEQTLMELTAHWDNAIKRRDELVPKCTEQKSEIDTLRKRFLVDFSEFTADAGWDTAKERLAEIRLEAKKKEDELTLQKDIHERALAEFTKKHEAATKRNADADKAHKAAQTLVIERERRAGEHKKLSEETRADCMAALQAHGFTIEAEYTAALVTEDELSIMIKQLVDYEKEGERLDAQQKRLTAETVGKVKPDLDKLTAEAEILNEAMAKLRAERDEVKGRYEQTGRILKELRHSAERFSKLEKQYAAVKQLSDTANGRLDFETYAQTAYFERVLSAANLRLNLMSQNRYTLLRRIDSDDARRRSGLEILVLDAYTGKSRSANSLSGGESFMASLSLSLGLSDVVQQSVGGIRLDAMFIDEGFGSLDAEVLELAVRTLSDMTGNGRIIGIISHVLELRERIDKQIWVEKTPLGSKISIIA